MHCEHIHIISAGESIHNTYPTTIQRSRGISHCFVIVEEDVYRQREDDPPYKRETKPKIIAAINEVRDVSAKMRIPFTEVKIPDVTLASVRDAVLDIHTRYPSATYSFNVTGGTKMLSLSLFMMALWLEGDVCITPWDTEYIPFSIPRMHLNDITRNPNYVSLIAILHTLGEATKDGWVLRKDLHTRMEKQYVPVKNRKDQKEKRVLNRGMMTEYLEQLITWGLVEGREAVHSKREKEYCLTEHGLFAWKFLERGSQSR